MKGRQDEPKDEKGRYSVNGLEVRIQTFRPRKRCTMLYTIKPKLNIYPFYSNTMETLTTGLEDKVS